MNLLFLQIRIVVYIKLDPNNEIDENNWIGSGLTIVEINPRSVSFKVEKIKYKKLEVEPDTDL